MDFKTFELMAKGAGLQAMDCGNFHWRLTGGLVGVNWYPASKRRTVYCNGGTGATSFSGTAEEAIAAALGKARTMAPGANKTKRMGQNRSLKIRLKWWRHGRRTCHWCRIDLCHFRNLTVDHVVPLFRGGSNLEDNLVPACHDCNKERGHQLTKKEG